MTFSCRAVLTSTLLLAALAACHSTQASGNGERPAARSSPQQPVSAPASTAEAPAEQPGAKPREAQAAYEPRSEPGDGQQYLQKMVGEWDVVKTFFPRDGGAPGVTKGTCTQRMIHGGRFLESDFVFNDANGQSTGTGMIGYEPQTRLFTSFWIDSRSTRFSVRHSEEAFDGTKITLVGASIGPPAANARRSRTVSVLEDNDRRLIHRQFSINPDGSERPVMQMEMTRR